MRGIRRKINQLNWIPSIPIVVVLLLGLSSCKLGKETIRFRDNGDNTVTDTQSGLMWGQMEGKLMTWNEAMDHCTALRLGGYQDWRLPTLQELTTLHVKVLMSDHQWYIEPVFKLPAEVGKSSKPGVWSQDAGSAAGLGDEALYRRALLFDQNGTDLSAQVSEKALVLAVRELPQKEIATGSEPKIQSPGIADKGATSPGDSKARGLGQQDKKPFDAPKVTSPFGPGRGEAARELPGARLDPNDPLIHEPPGGWVDPNSPLTHEPPGGMLQGKGTAANEPPGGRVDPDNPATHMPPGGPIDLQRGSAHEPPGGKAGPGVPALPR